MIFTSSIARVRESNLPLGFWGKLDPRIKLVCIFSLVIALSVTSIRDYMKFIGYLVLIIFLVILSKVRGKSYSRKILVFLPMLLFMMVSLLISPGSGGYETDRLVMASTGIKMLLVFSIVGILVLTVPFDQIIKGLEAMGTPKMIIIMLGFMYRYIFLFSQEAHRVVRAIKSRSYRGRKLWKQWKTIISIISFLLLRLLERSHRIYAAMISRGDIENLPRRNSLRFTFNDYMFGAGFHMALGLAVFVL